MLQSSSSPNQPSFPISAALSSCPPHGASSQDSCTSSSHKNTSSSSCSPGTPPTPSSVDLHSKKEQLSKRQPLEEVTGETSVLNFQSVSWKVTLDDDDNDDEDDEQSRSQAKPVALETEPTKIESQSHSRPLHRGEELLGAPEQTSPCRAEEEVQGARHWMVEEDELQDQSEAEEEEEEEEPVSPVPELDRHPSLDDAVMELMTSVSPPSTLRHLSSPSPLLFSRRGEGRALRPPPCSSRPSDDLSIRLRQSPFSTEASPETSPVRAPITPPPLSPASPPLHSFNAKEFVPLSQVSPF